MLKNKSKKVVDIMKKYNYHLIKLQDMENKSDDKNKQQLKEKYTESNRLMRGAYLFDYEYIFELHTEELWLGRM